MKDLTSWIAILSLAACSGRDAARERVDDGEARYYATTPATAAPPQEEDSGGTGTAMALEEGRMGKKDSGRAEGQYKMKKEAADKRTAGVLGEVSAGFDDAETIAGLGPGGGGTGWGTIGNGSGTGSGYGVGGGRGGMRGRPAAPAPKGKGGPADDGPEAATRSWFPETFLFEPLVVTDDAGAATVRVRVPDRLTNWRVLALAHSRQGAQGGATTSFLGTLPTYIDLVVPKFLVIGDEIELPIQMVNTTEAGVTSGLEISAKNAVLTGGGGTRTIPAQGGTVEYAKLKANRAGTIEIKASLGSSDAVVRTIAVRPAGRPETVTRAGTLAAPRTLTIEGPKGSDPETDRARLLVYPGALALLRSELGVSTFRQSVADDAYALLLAGRATALLAALGDKADPEAIRTLSILTGQRAIRDGRTLDVDRATLLTEAALAHPANPVLARLGERAASYLAQQQRPDGTFAGGSGWTLQRVLVATAEATRAVQSAHTTTTERQRAFGVAAKARGAFERNAEHVQDGYTAASILASRAATGELADKLREKVRAAIKSDPDGAAYLEVGEGVVRADGRAPSRVEATALAVLALEADPKAPLADLGTTLLGAYGPERGWGDGRANLACMQAVLALFKTPVPEGVKITLLMDGKPIADGTLNREALREVMTLEAAAPGFAGSHEWKVVAEPAVPGLGYALSLNGWVPWEKQTTEQGLEMALTPGPVTASVGKPVELTLTAIAPSNVDVHVVQSLPSGVQLDTPSLEALVQAGTIKKFELADGKLELFIPPLEPGQTFTAKYKAIATLAGKLRSAASTISASGVKFSVPPTEWTISK